MERLIRNLTKKYTGLLPDGTAFFTPDDLRKLDIPEFVIQRIEVEIYRNLNESIVPPDSEWADMSAPDVENAWEMFINAIVAEVRMPASYASSVFETSIADVLEMIIQPRKSIPAILFGPEQELSRSEILKRSRFITVHTHLSDAVIRYMDRKGKERVTREQSQKIVEQVDNRLTENYNSLNWAQFLHPLFLLAGPKVDSEHLRIFFQDRNLNKFARRFDLTEQPVNKTEFIEILSSPDLLNEDSYEDEPSTLFDVSSAPFSSGTEAETEQQEQSTDIRKEAEQNQDKKPAGKTGDRERQDTDKADQEETPWYAEEEEDLHVDEPEEDTLLSSFQNKRLESEEKDEEPDAEQFHPGIQDEEVEEDNAEENEEISSLYNQFFSDDEETEDPDESDHLFPDEETWDPISRDYEEKPDESVAESTSEELKQPKPVEKEQPSSDKRTPEEDLEMNLFGSDERDYVRPDEGSASDEKPIWQSFLGDEEHILDDDIEEPEYSAFSELNEFEEDEPLIDLTKNRDEENGNAEKLIGWMEDDEQRFTSSIFSGSDKAYEQALMELDEFENWKKASTYIEQEIFARNFVDMYDEDAVDFTDRMQTYFDQYKS
ncbi:hypothetical protein DYD21_10765 [Rhodohalobacter sp. SW132]|uniref:hypothetical protein n=1 Tax=Rhodohalobacter sp. SW132 TaxID=2293433 RepID=UPI000E27C92A|nr:hypothetical protein [Rhodohalobacter sp. SW132]REL33258.1 hypothetical protein DYD21_10765 [Rhodohalobacter sp. SW132]